MAHLIELLLIAPVLLLSVTLTSSRRGSWRGQPRPEVAGDFGPLPLVVALAATISIFLLHEFLYARADS